jgi:hypothetical protein
MKIRFVKNITADVEKIRLGEVWDKYFQRWDEILIENIHFSCTGTRADLITYDGDIILSVPIDSFEVIK